MWAGCPALSGMELGSYSTMVNGEEVTGDSQGLLAPLYFGRRCFYTENQAKNAEDCGKLWELLAEPASTKQEDFS